MLLTIEVLSSRICEYEVHDLIQVAALVALLQQASENPSQDLVQSGGPLVQHYACLS